MANFPSVTAAGAFESTAVQNTIKTLAEQAVNTRLDALGYYSGVRDVSTLLLNGLTGFARLWRVGSIVTIILPLDGNPSIEGTGLTGVMSLPVGFRPPSTVVNQIHPTDTSTRWDVTSGGSVRVSGASLRTPLNVTITYGTADAVPSSPPGAPA